MIVITSSFDGQSEESRLIDGKKSSYKDSCTFDDVVPKKIKPKLVIDCRWFAINNILWSFSILTLFLLVVYALSTSIHSTNQFLLLKTGSKIQLSSLKYTRYIRVESNVVKISEPIPWTHGSTFEVHNDDVNGCFHLKTPSNDWVSVDKLNGEVVADATTRYLATSFMAVPFDHVLITAEIPTTAFYRYSSSQTVQLRVCERENLWLQVKQYSMSTKQDSDDDDNVAQSITTDIRRRVDTNTVLKLMTGPKSTAVTPSPLLMTAASVLALVAKPLGLIFGSLSPASSAGDNTIVRNQDNSTFVDDPSQNSPPPSSAFQLSVLEPLHGVNLGGWFIPEVWMAPEMFVDTGLGWGGSLCRLVNYSRPLAEERMQTQLATWITETDIQQIASIGFNSLRVPLGYWNVISDPYHRYAPDNVNTSLHYLDWLMDVAASYNLSVLLDLHGAPGSQNGIDHSGCSEPPTWNTNANIALSLQAIDAMSIRYGSHPNLLGIELLNEPSLTYSLEDHLLLEEYYVSAYALVRAHCETCLVVFNELYEVAYPMWNLALQEPGYYNVAMDWHLYDWQEPFTSESKAQHVQDAKSWAALIEQYSAHFPIMIGEWCMSTGTVVQAGQVFVNTSLQSFDHSIGWFVWNWKLQKGLTGFEEWSVQTQYNKSEGLRIYL